VGDAHFRPLGVEGSTRLWEALAPEERALHVARGEALTRRQLMTLVATLERELATSPASS
jgi:hypothetical protein